MEGTTSIIEARNILGANFIGPDELNNIISHFPLKKSSNIGAIPPIPYSTSFLNNHKNDYLLILGIPQLQDNKTVTLVSLRTIFGIDPTLKEPCFYNQDWYLHESFATDTSLPFKWYFINKSIGEDTRGKQLNNIVSQFSKNETLPSAILTAYCFFAFYFHTNGQMLWKEDFVWCSDIDSNGDSIYTGRYIDIKGLNKNGFSIHRHLSIKNNYGASKVLQNS